MCVNDYQFRHFSAKRQKICRRFIFRTEDGHERAFNVNISQFEMYGQLCLCQILMHLSKKGLNVKDYSFTLPQFDITIEAGDKCKVPFEIMTSKEVIFEMHLSEKETYSENYDNLYFNPLSFHNNVEPQEPALAPCEQCSIHYMKQNHDNQLKQCSQQKNDIAETTQKQSSISEESKNSKNSHEYINIGYNIKIKDLGNGTEKKHKEQEKTVEEAIMKTKTWRMLHLNCNFSLKNAASLVELSKKTLDDYFLVLRVGEYHGYNFKANLTKKIGHLRAFIRNQPVKVTGRLPKQANCFSLVPEPDLTKFMGITNWQKTEHIQEQFAVHKSDQQMADENEMVPQ